MDFSDSYIAGGILRALVYIGTVLTAGACLYASSFPDASQSVRATLRRQIAIGAIIIVLVEPLRYALSQLAMTGGDAGMAFGPDMRWVGLELPAGHAILARLAGVGLIVLAGLRVPALGLLGSAFAIGSYVLEGHTAGDANPVWMPALLFVHVLAIHWWIGGLWPLATFARQTNATEAESDGLKATVERFGRIAVWLVVLLLIAGGLLLGEITQWQPDLSNPYHQIFGAKILAVIAILALAAFNKFRVTPLIRNDTQQGSVVLRATLRIEMVLALTILALTGFVTTTSPGQIQ